MKPELKAKILRFNKAVKEKGEKANDLDVIVSQMLKLPPGQVKKLLTDEILTVLSKYGFDKEAL